MIGWLRLQHWSMTYRLSFFFALSSLVLTSAMGIYLYTMLDRRLDEEHTIFLADDVDVIRRTLAEETGDLPLVDNPHWRQVITPVGSRLHLTIFNERGEVLVTAPTMTVPWAALPPAADIDQRVDHSITWTSPGGKYYRIVAAWARVGRAQTHKVLIALALEITLEHRLMARYYEALLITMLIVVLCAAMMGYIVTRQGLTPIRRITRAANEITSTRLDKRLELYDAPEELRELAAAFNGMLDRLRDSFSRLSQFSSDLSHELRTPINNLMGEAQVALSRGRTATEYREVLESSVEELERLSRMTEDMLFLASAEEPEAGVAAAWIDARDGLEKIAEFYQVMADELGVQIKCRGNAKLYADPTLFRRAIGNLLSNALHHTARGGEIEVELKGEPGGSATVAFRNPGPGIPPQHLTRIFDRFYRVESSREKSREGAGLGLAIVKTIMHLHGGTVSVTSEPNAPTIFTLYFPAPPNTIAMPAPSSRRA